jgi:iron complex outermembrane receptor protein
VAGLLQRRDNWVKNDYAARRSIRRTSKLSRLCRSLHARIRERPARPPAERPWPFAARHRAPVPRQRDQKGTNDLVPGYDIGHTAQNGDNPQSLDSWGINLQGSYAFGGVGTLYSITAWERADVFSRGDIDGSYPGAVPFQVQTGGDTSPKEFSQEVRFASEKFGDVSFQAGAYYFNQNLDNGSGSLEQRERLCADQRHASRQRDLCVLRFGRIYADQLADPARGRALVA